MCSFPALLIFVLSYFANEIKIGKAFFSARPLMYNPRGKEKSFAPMNTWIKGLPHIGEVSMELNEW
jgi:hypothetical protein